MMFCELHGQQDERNALADAEEVFCQLFFLHEVSGRAASVSGQSD